MLRNNKHFLFGTGIGILLVVLAITFSFYRNTHSKEPVIIYNESIPTNHEPETENTITSQDVMTQSIPNIDEKRHVDDSWNTDIDVSAEALEDETPSKLDVFTESLEPIPTVQAETPKNKDTRVIMLEEVFPEFDRLRDESYDLMKQIEQEGMTPDNYGEFEAKGVGLEAQFQDYCQRIADEFPNAVTFVAMDGVEGAYDVDFQVIQDTLGNNVSSKIEDYFIHGTLRKMLGFPAIPAELLQQIQIN